MEAELSDLPATELPESAETPARGAAEPAPAVTMATFLAGFDPARHRRDLVFESAFECA
jgi:hypothetical protein